MSTTPYIFPDSYPSRGPVQQPWPAYLQTSFFLFLFLSIFAAESQSAFGADHAAFLRSISGGLRRQVYIVVRGADGAQLDARCEEILTLLVPFGIRAARLGKEETVGLLARATGGGVPGSGQAAPGETVRGGIADAISP